MQTQIRELLKEAMKAKDEVRLSVYRGLLSNFTNENLQKGKSPQEPISDEDAMNVIKRAIKQRDDAASQYTNAGRGELAEKEIAEKEILLKFLPSQMDRGEVAKKVAEILGKQENLDPKMEGKYIGLVVRELRDVASGDVIKEEVLKFLKNN